MYIASTKSYPNYQKYTTLIPFFDLYSLQLNESTYELTITANRHSTQSISMNISDVKYTETKLILEAILTILNSNKDKDIIVDNKFITDYIKKHVLKEV